MELRKIKLKKIEILKFWNFGKLNFQNWNFGKLNLKIWNFGKLFLTMEFWKIEFKN